MLNKVLFLTGKNDLFTKKVISELRKKSKSLKVVITHGKKLGTKIDAKFDFIFAFRSYHILKKKLLNNVKFAAINFHPGPPGYRGIGCANYALYDNSKEYGATAHLIDEKIDHGKIINIIKFKIKKNDSVESLLQRTYNFQVKQIVQIIRSLSDDPTNFQKMVTSNKEKKWSKKMQKRNFLNRFYALSKNISRTELKNKIRATVTKKFKPYMTIYGEKFIYADSKESQHKEIPKKIILVGAGGHCVSCIDVIEMQRKFKIAGLIDDDKKILLHDYKVIGNDRELKKISSRVQYALITTGQIKDSKIRENLFKKVLNYGFKFPVIISPLSYVSQNASIGEGTIIMHDAVINAGTTIGKNCIINSKTLIEHDVVVGDNCHISTRSTVNGGVSIKKNSFIGSGSVIKQNVKIGKNCFLNANLFLQKNLKDNSKIL